MMLEGDMSQARIIFILLLYISESAKQKFVTQIILPLGILIYFKITQKHVPGQTFYRIDGNLCQRCACESSGGITCEVDSCPSGKSAHIQGKQALKEEGLANGAYILLPSLLLFLSSLFASFL